MDVNLDGRQLEKEIADLREQRQIELEALDAAKRYEAVLAGIHLNIFGLPPPPLVPD